MAIAERLIIEQPIEVMLSLSMQEAETLRAIFANVGGNPRTSRRKYADSMDDALAKIGIKNDSSDVQEGVRAIGFK